MKLTKNQILSQEQHDYLVKDLGFDKVRCRCPVCYTKNMIENNLKELGIVVED